MFSALLENALEKIGVVESFITNHDSHIATLPAGDKGLAKEYAAAACITRLYAIYENFIESLIEDYLNVIPEIIPYTSLPDEMKKAYRVGISHILNNLDGHRYGHMSHENIIKKYHEALSNTSGYQFVAEALIHHNQNLRLDTVCDMLAKVGLRDLGQWIDNNSDVIGICKVGSDPHLHINAAMKLFIQSRNDAAHGATGTIDGREILLGHCALVRCVSNAFASFFHYNLLMKMTVAGKYVKLGTVTEVFEKPGAFILTLEQGMTIEVGTDIHFAKIGECSNAEVGSLQSESAPVASASSTGPSVEVGVKCRVVPRKNSAVYKKNSVTALSTQVIAVEKSVTDLVTLAHGEDADIPGAAPAGEATTAEGQ